MLPRRSWATCTPEMSPTGYKDDRFECRALFKEEENHKGCRDIKTRVYGICWPQPERSAHNHTAPSEREEVGSTLLVPLGSPGKAAVVRGQRAALALLLPHLQSGLRTGGAGV